MTIEINKEDSLLPDNRSALERGIERALTQLVYASDNPYPHLLNPELTPVPILPHLAQERGVKEWQAAAPESEQRRTTANAWPVRRLAGTREGVRLALDSLEFDAEITAWQERQPKGAPYHFSVVATKREQAAINQQVVKRLHAQIVNSKSERDSYDLSLALSFHSNLQATGVDEMTLISEHCYESRL